MSLNLFDLLISINKLKNIRVSPGDIIRNSNWSVARWPALIPSIITRCNPPIAKNKNTGNPTCTLYWTPLPPSGGMGFFPVTPDDYLVAMCFCPESCVHTAVVKEDSKWDSVDWALLLVKHVFIWPLSMVPWTEVVWLKILCVLTYYGWVLFILVNQVVTV